MRRYKNQLRGPGNRPRQESGLVECNGTLRVRPPRKNSTKKGFLGRGLGIVEQKKRATGNDGLCQAHSPNDSVKLEHRPDFR